MYHRYDVEEAFLACGLPEKSCVKMFSALPENSTTESLKELWRELNFSPFLLGLFLDELVMKINRGNRFPSDQLRMEEL